MMKARWTILILFVLALTVASAMSVAATGITDTLKEGEAKGYTVGDIDVEVTNTFVSDPTSAGMEQQSNQPITILFVDGERSEALQTGQSKTFQDGLTMTIKAINASQRQGETTFTLSTEGTSSQPPPPPEHLTTQQGTGQDSPFFIVVATDASSEVIAESANLAAMLQQKTVEGGTLIPVGFALTDLSAYQTVSDDELASKLFIIMTQGHALLMDASSDSAGNDQYEHWAKDALENKGYTVAITKSPKREYLLVKNMAATFFPDWTPTPEPGMTGGDTDGVAAVEVTDTDHVTGTLRLGEPKLYAYEGMEYELLFVYLSDAGAGKFIVNGYTTPSLSVGESAQTPSGTLLVKKLVSASVDPASTIPPGDAAADFVFTFGSDSGQTPTACSADVKQCPDGSYVDRTGPDCAFALCPYTDHQNLDKKERDCEDKGGQWSCTQNENGTIDGCDCYLVNTPSSDNPNGMSDTPKGMSDTVKTDGNFCSNGCAADNRCIPYGTRLANGEEKYCSINGTFALQLEDGDSCQNNYECVSNQCYNAVCTSLEKQIQQNNSLLQKIFSWVSRILG